MYEFLNKLMVRLQRWDGIMAALCLTWVNSPNGNQQYHQEREDHLHVGQRVHPKRTQDDQLDYLDSCEEVHFPLRHTADVVGGRVRGLDGDKGIEKPL